jgi:transcriptional regulator with XRE-family HTH domain
MPENNEIGDAFAAALKKMLKDKGLSVQSAADRLGVTRQAFYAYLDGKLPRRKRLHRAIHLWDLKLDLGKYSFGKEAFPSEGQKVEAAPKPIQRTLWEALDAVKEEDLHVTMKRVGKVLRVDVRIEIPA